MKQMLDEFIFIGAYFGSKHGNLTILPIKYKHLVVHRWVKIAALGYLMPKCGEVITLALTRYDTLM